MKRKILCTILCAVLLLPLSSCDSMKKYTRTDLTLFDTETVITGYDVSEESFNTKADRITAFLTEYHKLYDIYNEYNGITNLKNVNDLAATAPVTVDSRIIDLLEFGKKMYKLTKGNTNIAMGSVTAVWHKYREEGTTVPGMDELNNAAGHTDINKIIIDKTSRTVKFEDPLIKLDVGAIAKGYATEMAAQMIEERGWTRIALSVGGNVRTVGTKDDGQPWITGIQNPLEDEPGAIAEKVSLVDKAAVTSGSYQRYYEVDGVRYHHIISPETLMPKNVYVSVTVVYRDSGVADALSTALFNMTEKEGRRILKKLGAQAMWIYPDGGRTMTSGFLT